MISCTASSSYNTLLFQQCLQKQAKKFPYAAESQSEALSTLTNFTVKPIHAHSSLNTCTITVSISLADNPVYGKNWSDWEEDLLSCSVGYGAVSVQCYIIPPRGCCKFSIIIAKITFHKHDLPMMFVLAESPSLSDHINSPPQLYTFCVPNLVMIDQTALHNHAYVSIVVTPTCIL